MYGRFLDMQSARKDYKPRHEPGTSTSTAVDVDINEGDCETLTLDGITGLIKRHSYEHYVSV